MTGEQLPTGRVVLGMDLAASADSVVVMVERDGGWRILGHTNEDGLTLPDGEEPVRAVSASETVTVGPIPAEAARLYYGEPSIIDRIDDTITEVTLCACGCRRAITDESSSPYFASPACQRRWHNSHVDDPMDVYQRRDAARVYERADGLAVPLQSPTGHPTPTPAPGRPGWRRIEPGPDPRGAAWRRCCPACTELVIPVAFEHEPEGDGDELTWRAGQAIRLECPTCQRMLLAPHYIATVTEHADRVVLELRDQQTRVRAPVTFRELESTPNPDQVLRWAWAQLERRLTRFNRGFAGSAAR